MYADDTHQTYADIIHSCLNEDLLNISRWLISNKLTLNVAKTEFMLIGSGQKLNACNRGNCNSRMRLSWPFIHSLGSLSNCRRWRRQQQCQKTIHRFYEQNNCSARVSHFLVHFFDVHCTTTTWNLPTRRFIGALRVDILQIFSLLYLNMDKALENLTPGKVTHIWRIERFQIDVIKFKRRKFVFFFFVMFSLPSSSSLLTVPITRCGSSWEKGEKRKRCSTWTLQKGTLRCRQPTHALGH